MEVVGEGPREKPVSRLGRSDQQLNSK